MITDLVQIKRLGEKQRDENLKFRAWLKRHNFVERKLKAIAQTVEDAIDCTACANCCRVATTQLNQRDIERLARFLGMKESEFLSAYTTVSKDEGVILQRNEGGCVLLDGNLCSVYEARPDTCQHFPHLVKGNGSLLSRMWHMPDRASYCPIVYNSLEAFKEETGYKK
jgi:Fe-S-cluster containining protein